MIKKLLTKKFLLLFLLIFYSTAVLLYGDINGRTGRTLKTTTAGCSCHSGTATPDVNVTFAGPDSVNIGQFVQYTLTVAKPSKTGAGLDIATRRGTLAPVSTNIHLSNGELTHNNNLPMTNGSITVTFRYTAPGTVGLDTLWATGNATNSNGNENGDDWNWAVSKRIVVRNPVGIIPNEVAVNYQLYQNYPNPFNPSTMITFDLPKNSVTSLVVYDILGNEVDVLSSGLLSQGRHEIEWNASDISSGVYYYVLRSDGFSETKKMMLIK